MKGFTSLLVVFALCASNASAFELLVSRSENAVSVYFKMPYAQIEEVFGRAPGVFTNAEGNVSFESLFEGTFEDADRLAQDIAYTMDGEGAVFEALSMMVHEPSYPLPFSTALEAETAIYICNAPTLTAQTKPDSLMWVGGWHAYPITAQDEMEITFPEVGRAPITVSLRHETARASELHTVELSDGGTLKIPTASSNWFSRLFSN